MIIDLAIKVIEPVGKSLLGAWRQIRPWIYTPPTCEPVSASITFYTTKEEADDLGTTR